MDDKAKIPPKKPWEIGLVRAWAATVGATFLIVLIISQFIPGGTPKNSDEWLTAIFSILLGSIAIASIFVGLWAFFRWICCWRNFRRFIFGLACFATLVAVFYAEEDWRGKHDWEAFKGQWEAKGERFDRDSVVPQPVPDDENFAMSPVWIAEDKSAFLSRPERAEAWYGDRIYSDSVSNFLRLLPMTTTDVVGTNWSWELPNTPGMGNWATAEMSHMKEWQSYYRHLAETNPLAEIAIPPQPQKPAQDVLLALSKFDPLIKQLRRDGRLPYCRFPIEYDDEDPPAILLPHLSAIRQCAGVVELRTLAELQNGQTNEALDDIDLMLRLVDANRDEPILISHLVRLAILQGALQPVYEGLANHQWTDGQMTDLDSRLAKFDFVTDYKFAMRGEMDLCENGFFDFVRHHRGEIFNYSSETTLGPSCSLPARLIADSIPSGWFYQNELRNDRFVEEYDVPIADTNHDIISPASVRRGEAATVIEKLHGGPYHRLERLTLGRLSGPAIQFAYGQNAVNLARIAIALERYRLAHGGFPDLLDALVPKFINPLPHDIINGQPLHYRRTSDGQFLLYSVGWNETDDGGVVVFEKGKTGRVDRKQGDWVWRYQKK